MVSEPETSGVTGTLHSLHGQSAFGSNFTYLEWLMYHTLMFKMVLFDQQPQRKLSTSEKAV